MTSIILAAHGRITTYFRQDIGRGFLHNGVDQGHNNGTPYDLEILAPADGVVTLTGTYYSYGQRIVIRHADGWRSLLAHHAAQFVKVGDRVTQGQIIARMGNTGTKYVHSHQELMDGLGNQKDPLQHLVQAAAVAAINLTTIPAAAEEEDDMGFYITTGAAAAKFWFSQSTGTKRSIGRDEWSVLRASGQPLNIVTVTAANLALIPGR